MALRMCSIECEPGIRKKMWTIQHFFFARIGMNLLKKIRNVPAQSEMD